MAIFGPKPWVNPFGKMSIFRLFKLLVFIAYKGVLLLYNTVKDIFLASITKKKNFEKMANFGPKPWVNTFGKMSIFGLFELLVFIALKGFFLFQNIVKDIFLAYTASKKNFEKWPYLDQNHGLTPFDKCQFFDFLICLFSQPRKAFFVLEYRKRHFPGLYCLKKKVRKTAIFGPKPWVNPFPKKANFSTFLISGFYRIEKRYFFLEYRKRHFPGLFT